MAKKCIGCDTIYKADLLECPECGREQCLTVPDPDVTIEEPVDSQFRTGSLLLYSGLLGLALPAPMLSIFPLTLGLLLFSRVEKAVLWTRWLMMAKIPITLIVFIFNPHALLVLSLLEAGSVLALLSKQERYVKVGMITFAATLAIGTIAVLYRIFF